MLGRTLLRRTLAVVIGTLIAVALALIASRGIALAADQQPLRSEWQTGTFTEPGAPLWAHDPNGVLCAFGCSEIDHSGRNGQAVGILCRRNNLLQVAYAADRPPVWTISGYVSPHGPIADCGLLDY